MFAQIIRGKVSDPNAVRSGIADDNEVFVLVRFESEEAARANSDKPEQGQWWAEMEKVFDSEPTFQDSNNVIVPSAGAPATAGFVQVMKVNPAIPTDRSS